MRRAVALISVSLCALLLAGCAGIAGRPAALKSDPQAGASFPPICRRASPPANMTCRKRRNITARPWPMIRAITSLLNLSFFYAVTSGDFEAAAKYAQSTVTVTPDERSARLTLAVMALKRKDYAEARKHVSLSAKGPFSVLTLSLFDAWAAAAQRDEAGMQKDLQSLLEQAGTENMAAFHTALLQDYLGKPDARRRPIRKRWAPACRRRGCWKVMAASWSVPAAPRKPSSCIAPISAMAACPA